MAPSVWEVFSRLFRGGGPPDEESGDETEEGRFVPSPLDLSVRIGHGGPEDEVVRELSEVEERARDIENDSRRY